MHFLSFILLIIHFLFYTEPMLIAVFITDMVILHEYVFIIIIIIIIIIVINNWTSKSFTMSRQPMPC